MRRIFVVALVVLACLSWSQARPYTKQTEPPVTRAEVHSLLEKQTVKGQPAEAPPDLWGRGLAIVAAAVGIIQSYFIFKTLKVTEKAADAAEDSAKAAIKSVEAAERAANESKSYSDETLRLTRQSADAATKSAATAERTLTAIERPWITFATPQIMHRNMGIAGGPGALGGTSGSPVHPSIVNSGKVPAILRAIGTEIYEGTRPPVASECVPELLSFRANGILAPGESLNISPLRMEYTHRQEERLYVAAAVEYEDLFGITHRSTCVWAFDPKFVQFVLFLADGFNEYT
jgi:hypothetical protein